MLHGPALLDCLQRGLLLGRHVRRCPAEPLRNLCARFDRFPREVKVKKQGLAISGQQQVGGLEVEVHEAALVRMLQRICQAETDPAYRFDIRSGSKSAPPMALARESDWSRHR